MSDTSGETTTSRAAGDRRAGDATPLRGAVADLENCLRRLRADLRGLEESVRPQLRSCAAAAREMALPPERYLVVVKRAVDRRPELHAEIEPASLVAPRWSRRDRLISWAIEEYFAGYPRPEG